MRRILLSAVLVLAAGAFLLIAGGASNGPSAAGTYKIEMDNAFGLVTGADFKVAGVRAGTIKKIELCGYDKSAHCQSALHAVVTVNVTQSGFGSFHSDAFCQSRPQSLIGEYFIDCDPGHAGQVLKPGSTIPVTRTESTIPADLVQNVMRLPYRERFTLIINELGAAVAGRSGDLQDALRRAVPALTETDNLLNLLANDAQTIKQLNVNADAVITALANNSSQVQRFIVEANNASRDTAAQRVAFQQTWQKLPAFLEQLRPALADLGASSDANTPVLQNLNAASGNLRRFFTDLVPFSHASLPALTSLGKASVTGSRAVTAAGPTIADLNRFTGPSGCQQYDLAQSVRAAGRNQITNCLPELAENLSLVLQDLDNRGRAVEKDPRSPNGQGYTGLEAVLQYVFNQTVAVNTYTQYGHQLTVDAFANQMCSPYATPGTIASNLAQNGAAYRQCYSWLGPSQPGVNESDPSNPNGCVPDPGASPGYPAYGSGPSTTAHKCAPPPALPASDRGSAPSSARPASRTRPLSAAAGVSGVAGALHALGSAGVRAPAINLGKTIGQLLSAFGGGRSGSSSGSSGTSSGSSGTVSGGNTSTSTSAGSQAQQLLNYLLAP